MDKDISLYDAARWIASMAAADGVVSPNERKILREFAETYDFNVSALYRMAYAIAHDIEIPEVEIVKYSEQKGRLFEEFVVSLCADKDRFQLLAWRGDKISGQTYALENLLPDLHIRHKLDNAEVEYLMECKYRTSWSEDGIDLSGQFTRYYYAAKERGTELFIVLGVGGTPSNPEELFIIPGRMISRDKKIHRERYVKYLCPKDTEEFHRYIQSYYRREILKYD
ncbi:MAG: hypothetical protein K2H50_09170 [Paramuribaculum sp.]|nr:hypothetical protein [Paramuribaculum sp.]MDE5837160.1 hypothetical protein [Paramuribaculum sp.]